MILYEKRGRRYHPVSDTEAYRGLPNGAWLVVIDEGRTSCREAVDDAAGLRALAAMARLEDELARLVDEAARARFDDDGKRPLSPKERRAIGAFCAIMGEDATLTLTRPSAAEIARRVASRIAELAKEGP